MVNLFIQLIQVSLGTRDMLSQAPSPSEWAVIFQEAQKHCVSSILLDGIERLPAEHRPLQQLLLKWIGVVQMNEKTHLLHCERAKELTKCFAKQGFKSCILKGVDFAYYYPVPSHRQGGDIDLWVDCDREVLLRWLKNRCTTEHILWHHVDAKFFDDVQTEIHYHPCWLYNPFYNRRLQQWFENRKREQMLVDEQLGFARPTVQFNAVYALVHLYHHIIEEGVGIRHILDYYFILLSLPVLDRPKVMSNLEYFGLLRLAQSIMWVLKEVCGLSSKYLICEPNEKEGRFILDEIARGGNFGRYRQDNRHRNSSGRVFALLPHYPKEVLWIVPWKLWHKLWRFVNA